MWHERAAVVREDGVGAVTEAALGRWFTRAFHNAHPDVVERFRSMLLGTSSEGYAACCEAIAALDLTDRLGQIEAPTLVVTGEHDPVAPPSSGEELAGAISDARHVVIPGAAHIANAERPEVFTRALLGFLEEGS
jgi:3-oxoadipate enol-lactonase